MRYTHSMHSVIIAVWWFFLGAAVGSFINVVVDRTPKGQSLNGRSHCDKCNKILKWFELIPVVSWIIQGGKCRSCKSAIPVRFAIVELLGGVIALTHSVPFALVGWTFLYISLWDYLYLEIPTPGVVFIFLLGFIIHGPLAAWYALSSLPLYVLFAITSSISHERLLGYGDAMLIFAAGTLLPLTGLFLGIYVGVVIGGLWAIALLFMGKAKRSSHIAFGPFLSLGILLVLLMV